MDLGVMVDFGRQAVAAREEISGKRCIARGKRWCGLDLGARWFVGFWPHRSVRHLRTRWFG